MNSELSQQKVEISLNGVSMVFGKKGKQVTVLQDITFDVHRNEFICLLGPADCGKSTLLRLMADMLQPSSGQILIEKEHPREVRLRRKFGIVLQHPTLFEWRTVQENVELPLEVLGQNRSEYRSKVDQLLETVGLTKFKDYYPWQVSGGIQQRVAIARALSLDPPILFMDEPFSALDDFTKDKLQFELFEIKKKMNKTIVFVTDNLSEAVFLSDRIIVLTAKPGRVHSIHHVGLGEERTLHTRESDQFHLISTAIQTSLFQGQSHKDV
ncbi:ABC transporter ATP-binding protein [Paenibacillus aceris]|uniref:NitT/TauT family transport system ATP-binding protein n=1 Tax=Paenibacillus aceris TaxID=869555 RepID=A0ABS4HRU5_9BACL|nr:ABC transporter ATP-binding protein [Paenibacillus aceris]MBP1960996.1 NitT/TauT family transport system ATP-binding protein [Paenibacillus aceris]NHW35339.1 ABC transporter ATP-binding protein [Paenibacillus aceris]